MAILPYSAGSVDRLSRHPSAIEDQPEVFYQAGLYRILVDGLAWQPVVKVSASPFGRILGRLRRRRSLEYL